MKRVLLQTALALSISGVASSGSLKIEPSPARQGDALQVVTATAAESARMDSQTVPVFRQGDGTYFTLFPVPVQAHPGERKLELLSAAGAVLEQQDVRVLDAHYKTQNVVLSKQLTALKSSSEEREQMEAFSKTITPERYWSEPLTAPVPGCATSPFGVGRLHNGKLTGDFHAGLDQRSPAGAPIHAVAAGVVRVVQQFELRGGTVAVDHGEGFESVYLHMSRFAVQPGMRVQRGDVIGYVGSTGRSTAPHLHWALYAFGQPVNPGQWISVSPCTTPKPATIKRHRPEA